MLNITFSNRLEPLLELLLANLRQMPDDPFAGVPVIVPNAAMRRRIQLAAADRFRVCANIEFSFLAQWMWNQIAEVVPVAKASPFAATTLAWRVLRAFEDEEFVGAHPRLASYMERADPVMRYELATGVAAVLEQYMTYRPEWLASWMEGKPVAMDKAGAAMGKAGAAMREDQEWQAALWRRITAEVGTDARHPAAAFLQALESGNADLRRHAVPQAVNVFCLPSIPPLYLNMLRRLGKMADLHLYVMNPCREYWFEIVDARYLGYLKARGKADYHEVGNRLLAAWGKQTRSHIDLLVDGAGGDVVSEAFMPSNGDSLLARLQNAILDMEELAPGSAAVMPGDRSIEVHQCHSLARELEVLHDQLLAIFAAPDAPAPSEILVALPRLEDAAPLIDAIFGSVPFERRIPYVITGRARSKSNPAAQALLDLLALATSRFHASQVYALLQQPLVGAKFALSGARLERVLSWLSEAEIRWGADGAHRGEFGAPATDAYTFADGLHRLFLGYAMPSGPDASCLPFLQRLPACGAEGSDAASLGALWRFVNELQTLRKDLAQPRLPDEWSAALLNALDTFVDAQDAHIDALREVREAIREVRLHMVEGGVDRPVPLALVVKALKAVLDSQSPGGVPHGAVTFTSLTSMRNAPYDVVCIIGLNDRDFPTSARPPEYDLMAGAPRRGDRQRSLDERNIFLDLILAARRRLYLSYTGRSAVDNSAMPPSVLLDDLLDYLAPSIADDPDSEEALAAARRRLIVEHPLQPFAPGYFLAGDDDRLASFNAEYCDALRAKMAASALAASARAAPAQTASAMAARAADDDDEEKAANPVLPFFSAPLAAAAADTNDRQVSLEQLIRFFRHPCRYLLQNRLRLAMADENIELLDDEPFAPDRNAKARLAKRVLPLLRQGATRDEARAVAMAGTEYPRGHVGAKLLDEELRLLREFADALQREERAEYLPPFHASLDITVDGARWRLDGAFADLQPHGLVRHRYGNAGAGDYLAGWISHLFINATCGTPGTAGVPEFTPVTTWISRNGLYRYRPCAEARTHLAALLSLYLRGQEMPLHFFPRSAWAYIQNDRSLAAAKKTWVSTGFARGEDDDSAYRLALRGCPDPLDEAFEQSAVAIYAPLMEHLEDDRL